MTIMLDTGGHGVGISEELVEKYQMKRDTSITTKGFLPAFGIVQKRHPVVIPNITIGNMEMTNIYAGYSEFNSKAKEKYQGPEFDLIMGLDVFVGYLEEVSFDWENGVLAFKKKISFSDGQPFLFYDSKVFTTFGSNGNYYTSVLDTGSPNDIIEKEVYLKNYTKKEAKKYGDYGYTEYTMNFELNATEILQLKIGDYNDGLNLVIGGEKVELLIGNNHKYLKFNLRDNRFELR